MHASKVLGRQALTGVAAVALLAGCGATVPRAPAGAPATTQGRAAAARVEVERTTRGVAVRGRAAADAEVDRTLRRVAARIYDEVARRRMVAHARRFRQGPAALTAEIGTVTGAHVTVVPRRGDPGTVPVTSLSGGPAELRVALPPVRAAELGATIAETHLRTLAAVARRILVAERHGPQAIAVARAVATDPRLVRAVATDDPAALRAAIVGLFREPRLHVVRIRATTASGRLVNDVGGPFVLAPTSRTVLAGGRRVGTATLSVQDDAGYVKLVHRFTGLKVQLRTPAGIVPGSDRLPAGGPTKHLRTEAFPSKPMTITLAP